MASPVVMETENSVAANATNSNVLTGELYERAPFSGLMRIHESGSAAGLRSQIFIAGQAVTGRRIVNAQNRVPVDPDDRVADELEVYEGQQIVWRVENTTAGALTHRGRVTIFPGDVVLE